MKVICIDAKPGIETGEVPLFKEGEILTAIQGRRFHSYKIKEYPLNKYGGVHTWNKTRFIPLSDIDERDLMDKPESHNDRVNREDRENEIIDRPLEKIEN